jgi:hypothetical protein
LPRMIRKKGWGPFWKNASPNSRVNNESGAGAIPTPDSCT